MDPVANPFAPGAGSRPPALTGRDELLETANIALRRIQAGRHAKSMMLLGLRGVGKTVLLVRIGELAESFGYVTAVIEAPEERRLAGLLVPKLRRLLYRISRREKARVLGNRALGALRNFASVFKVSHAEFEVGVKPEPGLASSGDLETDLTDLLVAIGEAARAADQPATILIDEVQYVHDEDLRALIVALHRISQRALPLIMFGAGLPQLAAVSGEAKSYSERLFDFPGIGPLDENAIEGAIRVPIVEAGAEVDDDALSEIAEQTQGYPYFLQEWGAHSWNIAPKSPVTLEDVVSASEKAVAGLDASFFRVRFDRLAPREREYLRAMADLGPGPHRSGEVAARLGIPVTSAGPLRTGLIRKGMIWSPSHGDTAFTVPVFDQYMFRAMPDWRPAGG